MTSWTIVVHFLAWVKDVSLLQKVQLGSGAQPASYSVDAGGGFIGWKVFVV